ncbi:hypothetical protein EYC59_04990 [Candidatus Saccharibacteria bacterium]|nr:MAG: hypothetical protein EYC59_04990 [Candidatus Saccharibacteria bacterium]
MSKELDIVLDNPTLTFPENVRYDFVFVNHDVPMSQYADILRQGSVVCEETPDTYPQNSRGQVAEALRIMSRICLWGHIDEDVDKLSNLLTFDDHASIADEFAYESSVKQILALSGSGVDYRAVDTFVADPENRADSPPRLGGKYENLLKSLSECPYRESLVLRQLSAIGYEKIAGSSDSEIIKVVYGPGHWPLAVGARRLGAVISKTYIDTTPRKIFDAWPSLQAPYYRARFSGLPVRNPIEFLATIHPAFAQIKDYKDMVDMDNRLETLEGLTA